VLKPALNVIQTIGPPLDLANLADKIARDALPLPLAIIVLMGSIYKVMELVCKSKQLTLLVKYKIVAIALQVLQDVTYAQADFIQLQILWEYRMSVLLVEQIAQPVKVEPHAKLAKQDSS